MAVAILFAGGCLSALIFRGRKRLVKGCVEYAFQMTPLLSRCHRAASSHSCLIY